MCLAQGPQRSDAGEARTRGPSVSSQESIGLSFILITHIKLGCVTSLSLQYGRFHYSPFANIQTPTTSTFFNRFR